MTTPPRTPLVIIGAGPGGYVAAFRAADLGVPVTLVDPAPHPGGVCLYRGCIPSKAYLHAARIIAEAREAAAIGIDLGTPRVDRERLTAWKDEVVRRLTSGLGQLSRQRKITFLQGTAVFEDERTLLVRRTDGREERLGFDHAILATGSSPVRIPFAPESDRIMDSTSALEMKDIPERLLIIGGGYIGLELGTVYARLGSAVSVVEMMPQLLTGADRDLAAFVEKRLRPQLEGVMTATRVVRMEVDGEKVHVTLETEDKTTLKEDYDRVLVSIGRRPNTEGLGLEKAGVELDGKGFVRTDLRRRTSNPHVLAIGDLTGQPMLAHKASYEGRVAAEVVAGRKAAYEPAAIPAVVFTDPEMAWCGLTETEARAANRPVKIAVFPWAASGRAVTLDRTDGLTKLVLDPETDRVLGMGLVGVGVGEMIAEGVLAVEMGATAEDLALSIHPHPTLSETVMEAAEAASGHSTHVYRAKKG